jgi:hypothetical protein
MADRVGVVFVGLAGVLVGVALTISCSETSSSPAPADAAQVGVCDCPVAEPPLRGRISEERHMETLPAAGTGLGTLSFNKSCSDPNAILLSGRCLLGSTGSKRLATMVSYGQTARTLYCEWRMQAAGPGEEDIPVDIGLQCLTPAMQD